MDKLRVSYNINEYPFATRHHENDITLMLHSH